MTFLMSPIGRAEETGPGDFESELRLLEGQDLQIEKISEQNDPVVNDAAKDLVEDQVNTQKSAVKREPAIVPPIKKTRRIPSR